MIANGPNSAPREVRDLPITIATLREVGLFGALSDEVLEYLALNSKDRARWGGGNRVPRGGARRPRDVRSA